MVTAPPVQGGCKVHGAVHKTRIERQRKGKEASWDAAQGERQRQGIERARGQPRKREPCKEKTVIVNERQKETDHRKCNGCYYEDAAGTQKTAEIHRERTDEHEGDIECAPHPRPLIVGDAQTAFEVRSA